MTLTSPEVGTTFTLGFFQALSPNHGFKDFLCNSSSHEDSNFVVPRCTVAGFSVPVQGLHTTFGSDAVIGSTCACPMGERRGFKSSRRKLDSKSPVLGRRRLAPAPAPEHRLTATKKNTRGKQAVRLPVTLRSPCAVTPRTLLPLLQQSSLESFDSAHHADHNYISERCERSDVQQSTYRRLRK